MSDQPPSRLTPAFDKRRFAAFVPSVSEAQLRDWKSNGLLEPSVINSARRGDSSYWSVRDVVLVSFAMLLRSVRYGSLSLSIRTVDGVLPRRREEIPPNAIFHWNGGNVFLGDARGGIPMALDQTVFLGNLFSIEEDVAERFQQTEAAAEWIDVADLIANPHKARGHSALARE